MYVLSEYGPQTICYHIQGGVSVLMNTDTINKNKNSTINDILIKNKAPNKGTWIKLNGKINPNKCLRKQVLTFDLLIINRAKIENKNNKI